MNSGDLARLSIGIAIALALGVMTWLILRQGRHIAEMRAEMAAEKKRQQDLAQKIVLPPPRNGDDDPKRRRHLHLAPVIGWCGGGIAFLYGKAREHPAASGVALSTMAAGGAVALTLQQPAVHEPNAEPPTVVITAAPPAGSPTRTPGRTTGRTETPPPSHRRRSTSLPGGTPGRTVNVPSSVPGPGLRPTAGPASAPVPTVIPPRSSAPVPEPPSPIPPPEPTPTPTTSGPSPSPTQSVPPTLPPSSPPTSAPPTIPPPTTPPPGKPERVCIVKLDVLGAIRVCVGSVLPQGPTAPARSGRPDLSRSADKSSPLQESSARAWPSVRQW